jgi:hydroxymethylbilane synthase
MQTKPFRIGTRGSPLALAQAYETRDRLMAAHGLPEALFEVVVLSTQGDRITDRPLSEIGGKGLFTEELEQQLLSGDLDFAVHSSNDMPTRLPDGLILSAYLPREDVRDAFIGAVGHRVAARPQRLSRRVAPARSVARPDLNVITFRGLVDTRLRKSPKASRCDAACFLIARPVAGRRPEPFDPKNFMASPGRDLRREPDHDDRSICLKRSRSR